MTIIYKQKNYIQDLVNNCESLKLEDIFDEQNLKKINKIVSEVLQSKKETLQKIYSTEVDCLFSQSFFFLDLFTIKEIYENKNTEIFIQSNTDLPFGLVIQYKNNKFCISSNPKKIMPEEIDSYNKLSEFQKTILTSYFFHYRDGYKVPSEKLIREIFKLIFSGTPYQIFPLYQKLYESQFSCIDFSKTTVGNEINKFQYKNDINKMIEELEKLCSSKHEEENYYMTLFSSFFELYSFHEEISDFFKYLDNEKLDETKTWNYINDIGEALVFFHNDFFNLFFKRFEGLDFMEFIPITDFIERIRNDKGNVSILLSNTHMEKEDKDIARFFLKTHLIEYDKAILVFKLLYPLLLINSSPFYSGENRKIAKKLIYVYKELFYDIFINRIYIQTHPIEGDPETRGSDNYSTRFCVFFTLPNSDIYQMRLDFPHKGEEFFHVNIQESKEDTMKDSFYPFSFEQRIKLKIEEKYFHQLFYSCANKFWFRINYEEEKNKLIEENKLKHKNLDELAKLENIQKHYPLDEYEEAEFLDFMNKYLEILELLDIKSFSEQKNFIKENEENSKYINAIRKNVNLINFICENRLEIYQNKIILFKYLHKNFNNNGFSLNEFCQIDLKTIFDDICKSLYM